MANILNLDVFQLVQLFLEYHFLKCNRTWLKYKKQEHCLPLATHSFENRCFVCRGENL